MTTRLIIKRIILGWLILIVLTMMLGRVVVAQSSAGQTAGNFLNIGVGARAAGMGGAFTAVAEGATATYWNPAGLTDVTKGAIEISHFEWYQDITVEHLSFAYNINDNSVVGAFVTYINYGLINGFDVNGQSTGELAASDWVGGLSFAFKLTDNISFGLNGKYINQTLDNSTGNAMAADLGFKYTADKVSIAGYLGNFGTDMDFNGYKEKIPTAGRLGLAFRPYGSKILTAVEIEKQFDGNLIMRQGVELTLKDQYYIRTGFNYAPDADNSIGSGMTFGAGVDLNLAQINYSFTPSENYSSEEIHRISLAFKFGQ